jgi:hypothetical protein
VPDRSTLGFDADPVVDSVSNSLLAPEMPFGRLNGNVPEEELNLFQFATRRMTQPSTVPAIVRREPLDTCFVGVLSDNVPDCLFRQTVTPGLANFVYPPKQPPAVRLAAWSQSSSNTLTQFGIGIVLV